MGDVAEPARCGRCVCQVRLTKHGEELLNQILGVAREDQRHEVALLGEEIDLVELDKLAFIFEKEQVLQYEVGQ